MTTTAVTSIPFKNTHVNDRQDPSNGYGKVLQSLETLFRQGKQLRMEGILEGQQISHARLDEDFFEYNGTEPELIDSYFNAEENRYLDLLSNVSKCQHESVLSQTEKIVEAIFEASLKSQKDLLSHLWSSLIDENELSLEWIFDNYRLGFSLEPDNLKSSWYLVGQSGDRLIAENGYLEEINLERLIDRFLTYIE